MPIRVSHLDASDVVRMKLGARGISVAEAKQLLRNRHELMRNPRSRGRTDRRLILVGQTDGGGVLTLVIEATHDPNSWVVVTGWTAARASVRCLVEMKNKKKDPWTDPDPQPGDFDDVLDDAESVEVIFDPDLEIRIISDEEAERIRLRPPADPAELVKPAKR